MEQLDLTLAEEVQEPCNGVVIYRPAHRSPRTAFREHLNRHNKLSHMCIECTRIYNRTAKERKALKERLMLEQEGLCGLCGADLWELPPRLRVLDHCHDTANPRKVVCAKCNTLFGTLEAHRLPFMEIVEKVISYHDEHK